VTAGSDFLARLEGLLTTADGTVRSAFAMLVVATRCRIDGGAAAADSLRGLPAAEGLQTLKPLDVAMAPTGELAGVARVRVLG